MEEYMRLAADIADLRQRVHQIGHLIEADHERRNGHAETPLSLTSAQRTRLLRILTEEFGPVSAMKALRRIEAEA